MAPFASSPWPRGRGRSISGGRFPGSAAFGGSGSMAGGGSFGCCGLVQGLWGLVEALLLPPSRGFPTERSRHLRSSSSQVSETRSPWDVGISSGPSVPREPRFYHQEYLSSVPRNPPPQQSDDDDDDCVIVAEKGQVACRDFPHSRHLCSNMPFGTTSHEKYCTMCYCFVCDAPAPCSYWGKALSVDDHCHATDKETKWKLLRQAFKQRSNGSGTSNGHTAQTSRPLALTVGALRAHPAAGAGRGTSNAHTALVAHSAEPSASAARPYSAARTGTGTSNAHTSQITRPVEATVSATRAYPAGRGISNAHTPQITRPVEQSVSAPRVHPAARAGSDSSNAHSAQITYPATANGYLPEPDAPEGATVYVGNLPYHIDNERLKLSFQHAGVVLFSKVIYDRETGKSRGFGFVTMNTVQEAEAAVGMYHGSVMYGRPLTVKIAAPRGAARVDNTGRQSGSPLRIFVCNLPAQVDHSRLEELFSKHGKVVDARVIYERQGEASSCSRGFGFVRMATEEESYNAIRALNKQVLEGHALGVKVARERPERGSPSPSNQTPLQNQNTHTSVGASLNVVPTVSVPRARSGSTSVSAPRPREHRILPVEG
uniref:Uncharacterized protein n=1 Tax=Avena sativa TaxID=4498 RepID=A0ACD5T770_AVESA